MEKFMRSAGAMKMGAGVTTASNVRKNKGENMEDYTLVQQFLLIGLDGTDSRHKSVAKSAVLRAAARENGQRDFLPPVTVKARALLTNWKKK